MRETDKFVFFWGGEDVFSNFHYSPFKHQGNVFKWSEQAVMYRKAKLFGANKIAMDILNAQSPQECKRLGRSRDILFDNNTWDSNKEEIYYSVLYDKFAIKKLRKELLKTGNKILAEASPFDKIWGIGLSATDRDAENPSKWKGLNLLGNVLMNVRDNIGDN